MKKIIFIAICVLWGSLLAAQPMTRLEARDASGTLREVRADGLGLPVEQAVPRLFDSFTLSASPVPQTFVTPAWAKKISLQVITMGKQVWYRIGTSTILVNGTGAELLTWAAEVDCGPGVSVGYVASEAASITVRISGR